MALGEALCGGQMSLFISSDCAVQFPQMLELNPSVVQRHDQGHAGGGRGRGAS